MVSRPQVSQVALGTDDMAKITSRAMSETLLTDSGREQQSEWIMRPNMKIWRTG